MDDNHPSLAPAVDWVNCFADVFENVIVFTYKKKECLVKSNVKIFEIGSNGFFKKLISTFRMIQSFFYTVNKGENVTVFYHMFSQPLFMLGAFYRFLKIDQAIWYSHSHKDIWLRLSEKYAQVIFSSSINSYPKPIPKNFVAVGHGVNLEKFPDGLERVKRKGIVSVGRISPIKKLEEIIPEIAKLSNKNLNTVTIIGPEDHLNPGYKQNLIELGFSTKIKVNFFGTVKNSELNKELINYEYYYTGTPGGTDKSTIEAALLGCFIISKNKDALQQSGMQAIWEHLNVPTPNEINKQIEALESNRHQWVQLRALLRETCIGRNNLNEKILEIINLIDKSSRP